MALYTVLHDRYGPDWPLGFIEVVAPGTPVRITSLVDASEFDAPESSNTLWEYSPSFSVLRFTALKPLSPPPKFHGTQDNFGNVYIVRKGGNRDDPGTIVLVLAPTIEIELPAGGFLGNGISAYRYYVDADNATDGVFVTGIVR